MTRPLLWDIFGEHLEDAGFLHAQRERALEAPDYTLEEMASGVEERFLAHLDALVLGGPEVAEELLYPVLEDDSADPELLAVAALAVLAGPAPDAEERVLKALAFDPEEAREAVIRALELSSRPALESKLVALIDGGGPGALAAVRVHGARGQAAALPLEKLIASGDPAVVAASLRLAGPAPDHHLTRAIVHLLDSPETSVREAAVEAALLARLPQGWELASNAPRSGLDSPAGLWAVAVDGNRRQVEELISLLDDAARRRQVLSALGYSGLPSTAEACLRYLDDEVAGALAAEAFSAITGAPVEALAAKPAEGEEEGPAPDEPIDTSPAADLPRLDPLRAQEWWAGQRPRFVKGAGRWLYGAPWSAGVLVEALRAGPMRRRPRLALELAIRTRSSPAPVRGWARDQLREPPSTAGFDDRPLADLFR